LVPADPLATSAGGRRSGRAPPGPVGCRPLVLGLLFSPPIHARPAVRDRGHHRPPRYHLPGQHAAHRPRGRLTDDTSPIDLTGTRCRPGDASCAAPEHERRPAAEEAAPVTQNPALSGHANSFDEWSTL